MPIYQSISHIMRIDCGTKMNDLDLCLEVVSRSCQPFLCHIRYYRGLVPKDHHPPIGNGLRGIKRSRGE